MSVTVGDKLGPYEISGRLGAGGMGEVWKARDLRLGRHVAIKTSQQRFSDRFRREAEALSKLNHPHICQIYDVGPDYLVMELIEGSPLRGPLPIRQSGRRNCRSSRDRAERTARRPNTAAQFRIRMSEEGHGQESLIAADLEKRQAFGVEGLRRR